MMRKLSNNEIDTMLRLGVNKPLIEENEKNAKKIGKQLEYDFSVKVYNGFNIVKNKEIALDCLEHGLILRSFEDVKFIVPLKVINATFDFAKKHDINIYAKSNFFKVLYSYKYENLKDKEIPIEEIGVYYNVDSFISDNHSVEIIKLQNRKKVSKLTQINVLRRLNNKEIIPLYALFIMAIFTGLLYAGVTFSFNRIFEPNLLGLIGYFITSFLLILSSLYHIYYEDFYTILLDKNKIIEDYLNENHQSFAIRLRFIYKCL